MKLWGGRFEEKTHEDVEKFSASMSLDYGLWAVDIEASMAHAQMLGQQGVLSLEESQKIQSGLLACFEDIQNGKIQLNPEAEDIHSEIEIHLTEKIGALAGKLHTARSRNDQVVTDTRLFLSKEIKNLFQNLTAIQKFILSVAENHKQTILPGFTHLQHAQPVSLAHHLLAYFWMFQRDRERLKDSLPRVLKLPLGSAALAGTGFPLNRGFVADKLGFTSVCENSLDAVSDRDFIIEFISNCATIMMHLSRLSEELILWSTPEFSFVQLSDKVTTGSSIMPQKKNPDVAELIRGKVGRLYGSLMGSLTMMKGLPLSYNRDLQEDKYYVFEAIDTTKSCVQLMHLMLQEAHWNTEKMQNSLHGDFSNATDLADDLVTKGLPFRQAHEVIGQLVQYCLKNKKSLEQLSLDELKLHSQLFDAQSLTVIPHMQVLRARTSEGGTAPSAVTVQIEKATRALDFSLKL